MPRSKRRLPTTQETYGRIRKPVAPPTQVEKDRRRDIEKELLENEAEEELFDSGDEGK